jgi:Fur family transcriptional regulator, ferric uptake regulator
MAIILLKRFSFTEMSTQSFADKLRENGCRMTPQRRALIEAVAASRGRLTASNVYERVQLQHAGIGLVTVYRMLELMERLGLICRVHGSDGCRSYLMRRQASHHHHLVCSSCGKVVDFTGCQVRMLEKKLAEETGFTIAGHLLEFEGTCRKCSSAQKDLPRPRTAQKKADDCT